MARKVFISFLGFTNYKECRYYKDDFCSESVRYIQEATLDYLLGKEEWSNNDVAYILLTDGAKTNNWLDNGHKVYGTNEPIIQEGLQTRLTEKHYPFQIKTVEQLPVGKNESELFEIFKRVYDVLEPGDKLYFDITHGFRSLPMLALVLVNYSKFLKGIEVKSITYGNFEVKEEIIDKEGGKYFKAPIIDLLPLSGIQDWTFAAADYLKNGNADRFMILSRDYRISLFKGLKSGDHKEAINISSLTTSLNAVTDDFQTCRGHEILSCENISSLKDYLNRLDKTVIEPLNPVIKKIEEAFAPFKKPDKKGEANYTNGLEAARWCIDNNLYQQAATILQETVVSFFCHKYNLDIDKESQRKLVNGAFAKVKKINSSKTKADEMELIKSEIQKCPITKNFIVDDVLSNREVYEAFNLLTDERNDINHSGMRPQPHSAETIRKNIKKAFDVLYCHFVELKV